jgi:hypothetical protein
LVFVCVALLALLTTVEAQPAEGEARIALDAGLELLQQRRYGEAITSLERAAALTRDPRVQYNLALAYRGAGRPTAAVQTFERYLASPDPRDPAARLAAIRGEVEALRRSLVPLRVQLAPPTAELRVDGRLTALTAEGATLDPGAHVLEWSAPGHVSQRQELTLVSGTPVTLEISLRELAAAVPTPAAVAPQAAAPQTPAPPRLRVEPSVASARVVIDGTPAGLGVVEQQVPAGEHEVVVVAPGYARVTRRVRVGAEGTSRVSITLAPERRTPGWVLPVVIAGGAALVTGAVLGVAWFTRGTAEPTTSDWGVVREP